MHYAHTLEGLPPESWEPLPVHLDEVAKLAGEFASAFAASEWAEACGRWHDLGKYSVEFQDKLRLANGYEAHLEGQPGRVDHSTAGAQHAQECIARVGWLLAYVIAGHHSGLADASALAERLREREVRPWRPFADEQYLTAPELGLPPITTSHRDPRRFGFQAAFFTRMLFSCLVDADRLATERFCDGESARRRTPLPELSSLADALRAHLDRLLEAAKPTPVNASRRFVLEACRAAASEPPGFFSLSVPTGGGKTLASLEFACQHANRHGLRRVVVAIPFTSIIEQTAEVYRDVFTSLGAGAVLEHHSNLDPQRVDFRSHLSAENWDAPLIVTTNVQLFESLYASRTTPCRKLHRLAGSVIVLDEAQTLPASLLKPCLWALRELVVDYRCSVVLCTATQPALAKSSEFPIGLEGIREIIPHREQLYATMRRVEVENLGPLADDELVSRLAAEPSWLAIVNLKRHAAEVYRRVRALMGGDAEGLFHLSTNLCGQHRSDQLKIIRERLDRQLLTRVVSTQLVEAGVDVDFPLVFRAMAGVDSIAQAAGRCNREGRLTELGKLYLFDPTQYPLRGDLAMTAAKTRELLPDFPDPLELDAVQRYFELYYWSRRGDHAWDDANVLGCFPEESGQFAYNFRTASERFRMIEDATESVFVPYSRGARLIERLRRKGPDRRLLRRLQRYVVGVRPWQIQALFAAGDIDNSSGYYVLLNTDIYDKALGLMVDRPGEWRPETLMV